MNIRKIIATLSLSAMALNFAVVPAAATSNSWTFEATGNGVESNNEIEFHADQDTDVNQSNEFNSSTNVNASANTGSNSADRNTGGNASIDTGNATSNVEVVNAGNSNEADVDCCGAQGAEVLVSGNGDSSDNKVDLRMDNDVDIDQENESNIDNDIENDATTGWNSADRNTGGSVEITTGKAEATTLVFNGGNVNSARVSGEGSLGGGLSARILGNGVDSDNDIWLRLGHDVDVDQENSARIDNRVDTDAVSGKNDARRNTGGDVVIDTGDAEATVIVDNAVNFNFADVDCGCLFDVTAKIAENGDSSDNKIKATLEDDLDVDQENSCGESRGHYLPRILERFSFNGGHHSDDCLETDIYADAFSGWNDADRNTGEADSDPSITTGNAETTVEVENAGNSNVFGDVSDWDFPGDDDHSGNGVNVTINFDLATLLELLGLSS